ncbi:MAG: histidine ammonia-lyase [Desulfobacteraceae bacterium]|nr:histidine ammonia-lyase [Desulfobacteraceae bacterium]
MSRTISLGYDGLTLDDLMTIARQHAAVKITKPAAARILKSQALIEKWVEAEYNVYGITTGFGLLSEVMISVDDSRLLQKNLLMSHASGGGDPLPEDVVRAVMALRIKDLAKGHSGIRLETVHRLVGMLNKGVVPVVPEKGSVGASGDLCPLAHLCLVLIGMGEAVVTGERVSGAVALAKFGWNPLELHAGEGLALINGTQVMTAIGALAAVDATALCKLIDVAAAMSLEVLMGSRTEFDPRIQEVRPHPGQAAAADNMLRITLNSEIITSHKDCARVQDAYTLRCSPQVHGASRDAVKYTADVLETEINSATGNPLIFNDSETYFSGGNFHGQPVALAMDFMGMALAELANISERRIERLVNPKLSGLPAFLVSDGGLNSGYMIAQYTAAALVSENKVLAHPASVDSIPTSANKEDHVSMGTIAARKCREILSNVEHVIAIEFLCAAQALDLFTNLKPGEGTKAAYEVIRGTIPHLDKDRVLSPDIAAVVDLMRSGKILAAVEGRLGKLK